MSIFTSASGKSIYRGYDYFLNDKVSQLIKISDTEYGATSCQRRTEPAEQQPATSAFLTK